MSFSSCRSMYGTCSITVSFRVLYSLWYETEKKELIFKIPCMQHNTCSYVMLLWYEKPQAFEKVKHWWIMLYGDLALTSPAFLRSPLSFICIIYIDLKLHLNCFFLCCFCSIIICKNVVKEINKMNLNLENPMTVSWCKIIESLQ